MTQTDGVLVQDWSKFAQDMAKLYLQNKTANQNSVVPNDDVQVVAPTQTPSTTVRVINWQSPAVLGGLALAALLVVWMLRR